MDRPRVAVTLGDPAGIGPEIVAKALARREVWTACVPIVVGSRGTLAEARSRAHGARGGNGDGGALPADDARIVEPEGIARLSYTVGRPSAETGKIAVASIRCAVGMVRSGEADALATAPISKIGLFQAGFPYRDHTGLLTGIFGKAPAMMLVSDSLRVLHATGHVALRDVPRRINNKLVWDNLFLLDRVLRRIGFDAPRLGVAGLNPHAGEGGTIGWEEEEVIGITVAHAGTHLNVAHPLAPDVVFRLAADGAFDGVLCFLHDHGHIAVKMISGIEAVQISAGLPIVRTSPAHGTALDIAGKGKADEEGMVRAIVLAAKLASTPEPAGAVPPPPPGFTWHRLDRKKPPRGKREAAARARRPPHARKRGATK